MRGCRTRLGRSIAALLLAACLSGCLGVNGLTTRVQRFNLTAAEGPWGREFLFLGMFVVPVYPLCILADMLVLNSIEFWTGKNPINGKAALVDIPKSEIDKLGLDSVEVARVERVDETLAYLHLEFENGDRATFDVVRNGDSYTVSYRGVEFFRGRLRL